MTTITETVRDTSTSESSDAEQVCEVSVRLKLVRWLEWPTIKFKECGKPATWATINMCCGSKTLVCQMHHDLVVNVPASHRDIQCGECGEMTTLLWSRIR